MSKNIDLISEAMAIEAQSAVEADSVGFMARAMVQATMPHSKPTEHHHTRVNGDFRLTMMASPEIGLPYGSVPRLILAFVGTEAVRTQEREIALGDSMSSFMRELDMVPTGGRWGSVTRLKDQSKRLFGSVITTVYATDKRFINAKPFSVGKADLWWGPQQPDQLGLFQSTVELSEEFYDEIVASPVPVDMRVLRQLKKSPLALDTYNWITYRIFTLNQSKSPEVLVPWDLLQMQFGSSYPETPVGRAGFKRKFLKQLRKVQLFYPEAKISVLPNGLLLKKSPLHISSKPVDNSVE